MPRCVTVAAPAKVNLHLQVLGPRADGYHELLSLFQAVSLADTIGLRRAGPAGSFFLRGRFDVQASENLITRAVEAFRAETGLTDGVEADVEKSIPAGSGLGGGSSDAAATLRGMEALFGIPLAPMRMRALAENLGSDVPFFLEAAAAVVEGRGERVLPLAARVDFAIVAALPGVPIRTAEAFRWIDEEWGSRPAGGAVSRGELIRAYGSEPVERWGFTNDFDGPVFRRHPALRALRDGLLTAGAAAARLSGSGSAVIGVCRGREEAEACARSLRAAPAPAAGAPRVEVLFPLASLAGIC